MPTPERSAVSEPIAVRPFGDGVLKALKKTSTRLLKPCRLPPPGHASTLDAQAHRLLHAIDERVKRVAQQRA